MVYVADFVANAAGRRAAHPVGLRGAGGRRPTSCSRACSRSPCSRPSASWCRRPRPGPSTAAAPASARTIRATSAPGPIRSARCCRPRSALGVPPVQFESGVTGAGERGNQPPYRSTLGPGQVVPVGEVTVTPEFTSGRQFPQLTERQALDGSTINGIDQGNFTLGPSADARITFIDEVAQFQNTLGVYLIDADGTIRSPKIVFPQIEHADADPSQPVPRPGGGPLQTGDAVLLSQLYDPGELQEGTQFGLFYIAEGWTLNGARLNGELEFQPASIDDPTPRLFSTVGGDVFEIEGNDLPQRRSDPGRRARQPAQRRAATIQAISGLEADVGGLTVTFEDMVLLERRRRTTISTTRPFRSICCRPRSSTSASCRRSRPTSRSTTPTAAISAAPPSRSSGDPGRRAGDHGIARRHRDHRARGRQRRPRGARGRRAGRDLRDASFAASRCRRAARSASAWSASRSWTTRARPASRRRSASTSAPRTLVTGGDGSEPLAGHRRHRSDLRSRRRRSAVRPRGQRSARRRRRRRHASTAAPGTTCCSAAPATTR